MNKVRVLAIAPDGSVSTLRNILDCQDINCIRAVCAETGQIDNCISLPFEAAVMYSESLDGSDMRILERLYMARQDVVFILLCDSCTSDVYARAMHCGVSRVISTEEDPDSICRAVVEEAERSEARRNHAAVRTHESRVIAFFSSKGGSGKTTTAVNTAVLLAAGGKKTALVDADLQFGDIAGMMDIPKCETIAELAEEPVITPATVKNYLQKTKCGVDTIIAPMQPEQNSTVKPSCLEAIIAALRSEYDYAVIDLASVLDVATLAVLNASDTVYFIINPDISMLRSAKQCLASLDRYGLTEKIRPVLVGKGRSVIGLSDVQQALRVKPCAFIPAGGDELTDSANRGIPLAAGSSSGRTAKAYRRFAAEEFGIESGKPGLSGLFRAPGRQGGDR